MYDAHIRQRNFIREGLVMHTKLTYPNTWRFVGNYKPTLCQRIMGANLAAFSN